MRVGHLQSGCKPFSQERTMVVQTEIGWAPVRSDHGGHGDVLRVLLRVLLRVVCDEGSAAGSAAG